MYILVNKDTNKVFQVSKNKFNSYSDNLLLCEVESLPQSYDYLQAENIREETKTWQEVVEDYDDNGNVVARTEERSKTYFTCDLVAKFRPQPTIEQIENQKKQKYKALCKKYIRERYSEDDELEFSRKYMVNPNDNTLKIEILEYNTYVENCLLKAYNETYKQ